MDFGPKTVENPRKTCEKSRLGAPIGHSEPRGVHRLHHLALEDALAEVVRLILALPALDERLDDALKPSHRAPKMMYKLYYSTSLFFLSLYICIRGVYICIYVCICIYIFIYSLL